MSVSQTIAEKIKAIQKEFNEYFINPPSFQEYNPAIIEEKRKEYYDKGYTTFKEKVSVQKVIADQAKSNLIDEVNKAKYPARYGITTNDKILGELKRQNAASFYNQFSNNPTAIAGEVSNAFNQKEYEYGNNLSDLYFAAHEHDKNLLAGDYYKAYQDLKGFQTKINDSSNITFKNVEADLLGGLSKKSDIFLQAIENRNLIVFFNDDVRTMKDEYTKKMMDVQEKYGADEMNKVNQIAAKPFV